MFNSRYLRFLTGAARPIAVDSANRWLDNLHTLRSWLRKKFAGMEHSVDSLFREVRQEAMSR